MRRADRLFQIIQILRRARAPLTAEPSPRSWRRPSAPSIATSPTLIGQRVPIRGEAGIGYVLEGGFDLPPLMLTPGRDRGGGPGRAMGGGPGDPALARRRRPDGQDRRGGARAPAALRCWTPAGVAPAALEAGPDRSTWPRCAPRSMPGARSPCTTATSTARAPSAPSGRSPSAITRRCGMLVGLVRAALGFPQFPHRPGDRRRLSRRDISRAACRAASALAQKPGLGATERCLIHRRIRASHAAPAVPIRRTGRGSRSRTTQRWR